MTDRNPASAVRRPSSVETWYRIGVIIPETNTTVERDFWRNLPPTVTTHPSRLPGTGGSIGGLDKIIDVAIPAAARQLAYVRPHVVVNGVTMVSSLRGNAYEDELSEELGRLAGAPTLSAMSETRRQLRELGAKRIAAISPYHDDHNVKVKAGLEAAGFEVTAFYGMGITDNFELCAVPPDQVFAFAIEKLSDVPADAILCMSTALRAVECLPQLRAAFPVPVVASNDAALQACRRILGL
ncbi:MAG: hypothetical protein HY329_08185 [Chloroflexi bacterium]|nr:hypothetical protein [Chloroflexota bacterium]